MTPSRAPSRCTQCKQLATNGGRCDDHQVKPWANKSQHTKNVNRSKQAKNRRQLLAEDPACANCRLNEVSELELDHITELADGGDPYDLNNLQLLCKDCHRAKTNLVRKQRTYRKNDR